MLYQNCALLFEPHYVFRPSLPVVLSREWRLRRCRKTAMSKPEQGAALFGHEFDFDQGTARRQIGPALPSPSERDAAMWYDFCISSTRKVPGADLDAKNAPGAGIEGMLLAEPARHEGGLDEEPENRFRRCGNENLPFRVLVHSRLALLVYSADHGS